MITIISGDLDALKKEMLEHKKTAAAKASEVRKRNKRLQPHAMSKTDRDILTANEVAQVRYSISRTLPAYVGNRILDIKTAQDFLKKLKGFQIEAKLIPRGLQLKYWRPGRRSKGFGVVTLYDLSKYFGNLQHIPTAQIEGLETS